MFLEEYEATICHYVCGKSHTYYIILHNNLKAYLYNIGSFFCSINLIEWFFRRKTYFYRISIVHIYLAHAQSYLMKHVISFWYHSQLKGWSFAQSPQRNHWHFKKDKPFEWCPPSLHFNSFFKRSVHEKTHRVHWSSGRSFLNPYLLFHNPGLNG